MGWSSGSRLFSAVITEVKAEVLDKEVRKRIYSNLVAAFEEEDWDTMDECLGEDDVYDELLAERFPE